MNADRYQVGVKWEPRPRGANHRPPAVVQLRVQPGAELFELTPGQARAMGLALIAAALGAAGRIAVPSARQVR